MIMILPRILKVDAKRGHSETTVMRGFVPDFKDELGGSIDFGCDEFVIPAGLHLFLKYGGFAQDQNAERTTD